MTLEAATALRELAQGSENRSKIGRLRSVYAEVLEAQNAGVSNRKIVETLNSEGFNLTLKTFETMLYRIRHQAGGYCHNPRQSQIPAEKNGVSKIFNPADVRKSRTRKIDLNDYKE